MQAAAEEGFVHVHAVNPAVAAKVQEEGLHQVVGVVPQGQVRQLVARAEFKQPLAPEPGAAEAGRTTQIFSRMGFGAVVCHLHMAGDALPGQPARQGRVALRIKTWIKVQGHDFKGKGHNALADLQGLEQHKAVYPAGYGHAHPAAGPEHAGPLHGPAGAFDAELLRERTFFTFIARHVVCSLCCRLCP